MDIKELVDKAKAFQAKVDTCEKGKGHNYIVHGFSKLTYPELLKTHIPDPANPNQFHFASYACTRCGNRVSVEEGREYMAKKQRLRKAPN